jgi:hypothetical protein
MNFTFKKEDHPVTRITLGDRVGLNWRVAQFEFERQSRL